MSSLAQKARSAMLWDMVGLGGVSLIMFVAALVYQNMLKQEPYGVFILILASTGFLAQLFALGGEQSLGRFIPQFRAENREGLTPILVSRLIILRLIFFVLLTVVLLVAYGWVSTLTGGHKGWLEKNLPQMYLAYIIPLLGIYLFQDLFATILVTHYQQQFLNAAKLILNISLVVFSVFLMLLGWGIYGPLLITVVATGIYLVVLVVRAWQIALAPALAKPGGEMPWKTFFNFAGPTYIYNLMSYVLGKTMDLWIINVYWGATVAGSYNYGYGLPYQALLLVVMIFGGGFVLPLVSELYTRKNFDALRRVYVAMIEFVYLFALPVAAGGCVLAAPLVIALYSKPVNEAIAAAAVYFVTMGLVRIGGAPATFMGGMDRQYQLIYSRIGGGIVNLGLDLYLVPRMGIMGAVIATSIAGFLSVLYEAYIVHQLIHPKYPWMFLGKVLLASLIMAGVVWMSSHLLLGSILVGMPADKTGRILDLVNALISTVIGAAVYLALIIWLKPISQEHLATMAETRMPFKHKILPLLGYYGQ